MKPNETTFHITDIPRKKILILGPSFGAVSGVSTHLRQLFGSDLCHDFHLVHFQVGSEGRNEGWLGKLRRVLLSPIELGLTIALTRPDIVHLNTSMNPKGFWRDMVYLVVAHVLGSKIVFQVHGGVMPQTFCYGRQAFRLLLRKILMIPDAVVVLSNLAKQAYDAFVPLKRLAIIPNAIELEAYAGSEEKNFDVEPLRLVYIGRIAHDKGIQHAIEAVRILRKQYAVEKILFEIAGVGPDEKRFREMVKNLGIEDIVKFIGPVFGLEKIVFWQNAHVFIFPTFHEGLPYALLESLASGTPVITTQVGGIPDVVQENVHAIFIPPHHSLELAIAIKALMDDRAKLKKMSLNGKARARDDYGIEILARNFRQLYGAMVGKGYALTNEKTV